MSWRVEHTRTFLRELARLPKPYRTRIEKIAFGKRIAKDPLSVGNMRKLVGYDTYCRVRVGV